MKPYYLNLLIILCWSGCATQPTDQPVFVELPKLGEKAERLNNATETISKHTQKPEVLNETAKIDVVATELRVDDKVVMDMQLQILSLQDEITKLKSEGQKFIQACYNWAFVIGGICSLSGLALLVISIKVPFLGAYAILVSIFGVITLAGARFLSSNDWAMAVLGGACVLGLGVYGIYLFIASRREKIALIDAVKTSELQKKYIPNWKDDVENLIGQVQAPSSYNIIKAIRKKEVNNLA